MFKITTKVGGGGGGGYLVYLLIYSALFCCWLRIVNRLTAKLEQHKNMKPDQVLPPESSVLAIEWIRENSSLDCSLERNTRSDNNYIKDLKKYTGLTVPHYGGFARPLNFTGKNNYLI